MERCPIPPDLLDLLVCPVSRAPVRWAGGLLVSSDGETRRAYRIDDGIPVLLAEQAETLEPDRWQALLAGSSR